VSHSHWCSFLWLGFRRRRLGIGIRGLGAFALIVYLLCFSFRRSLIRTLLKSDVSFCSLLRLLLCSFKVVFIIARLKSVSSCTRGLAMPSEGISTDQSRFDKPRGCSFVHRHIPLRYRSFCSLNLVEVLLYSSEFDEDWMFASFDPIESQIC